MQNIILLILCLAIGIALRRFGRVPDNAHTLGTYLVLSTLGVIVACVCSRGSASAWDVFMLVVTLVLLIAAIALMGVTYPPWLNHVLLRLGATLAPHALVSIGLQLRFDARRSNRALLAMGLGYKLVLAPALLAAMFFGLTGLGGTTFQQKRQTGLFGKRFTASFGILALVALVISPAAAQPAGTGIITSPGGAFDPCQSSPRIIFAAASPSIGLGTSTNLNWSVQTPDGCGYSFSMIVLARPQINLSPDAPQDWAIWTSSIGVAAQINGSLPVQPAFNTVYRLIVAWGPNSYSAQVKVAVILPLANPKCFYVANPSTSLMTAPTRGPAAGFTPVRPCRNRVTIDANDLAPLLVQALGTPNTTVIVKNGVELDLTPHLGDPQVGGGIHIAEGVQLIGERVAEPGKRFQPGPRLFVTPDPNVPDPVSDPSFLSHWPAPLFLIGGDNVRVSGVRLEGPGAPPDAWRAQVVRPQCPLTSCAQGYAKGVAFADKLQIEIDHNEFSGWNTAAVEATSSPFWGKRSRVGDVDEQGGGGFVGDPLSRWARARLHPRQLLSRQLVPE